MKAWVIFFVIVGALWLMVVLTDEPNEMINAVTVEPTPQVIYVPVYIEKTAEPVQELFVGQTVQSVKELFGESKRLRYARVGNLKHEIHGWRSGNTGIVVEFKNDELVKWRWVDLTPAPEDDIVLFMDIVLIYF